MRKPPLMMTVNVYLLIAAVIVGQGSAQTDNKENDAANTGGSPIDGLSFLSTPPPPPPLPPIKMFTDSSSNSNNNNNNSSNNSMDDSISDITSRAFAQYLPGGLKNVVMLSNLYNNGGILDNSQPAAAIPSEFESSGIIREPVNAKAADSSPISLNSYPFDMLNDQTNTSYFSSENNFNALSVSPDVGTSGSAPVVASVASLESRFSNTFSGRQGTGSRFVDTNSGVQSFGFLKSEPVNDADMKINFGTTNEDNRQNPDPLSLFNDAAEQQNTASDQKGTSLFGMGGQLREPAMDQQGTMFGMNGQLQNTAMDQQEPPLFGMFGMDQKGTSLSDKGIQDQAEANSDSGLNSGFFEEVPAEPSRLDINQFGLSALNLDIQTTTQPSVEGPIIRAVPNQSLTYNTGVELPMNTFDKRETDIKPRKNAPIMIVSGQFVDQSNSPVFRVKSKFVDLSGQTTTIADATFAPKPENDLSTIDMNAQQTTPMPPSAINPEISQGNAPKNINMISLNFTDLSHNMAETNRHITTIESTANNQAAVTTTMQVPLAGPVAKVTDKQLKVDNLYPEAPFPIQPGLGVVSLNGDISRSKATAPESNVENTFVKQDPALNTQAIVPTVNVLSGKDASNVIGGIGGTNAVNLDVGAQNTNSEPVQVIPKIPRLNPGTADDRLHTEPNVQVINNIDNTFRNNNPNNLANDNMNRNSVNTFNNFGNRNSNRNGILGNQINIPSGPTGVFSNGMSQNAANNDMFDVGINNNNVLSNSARSNGQVRPGEVNTLNNVPLIKPMQGSNMVNINGMNNGMVDLNPEQINRNKINGQNGLSGGRGSVNGQAVQTNTQNQQTGSRNNQQINSIPSVEQPRINGGLEINQGNRPFVESSFIPGTNGQSQQINGRNQVNTVVQNQNIRNQQIMGSGLTMQNIPQQPNNVRGTQSNQQNAMNQQQNVMNQQQNVMNQQNGMNQQQSVMNQQNAINQQNLNNQRNSMNQQNFINQQNSPRGQPKGPIGVLAPPRQPNGQTQQNGQFVNGQNIQRNSPIQTNGQFQANVPQQPKAPFVQSKGPITQNGRQADGSIPRQQQNMNPQQNNLVGRFVRPIQSGQQNGPLVSNIQSNQGNVQTGQQIPMQTGMQQNMQIQQNNRNGQTGQNIMGQSGNQNIRNPSQQQNRQVGQNIPMMGVPPSQQNGQSVQNLRNGQTNMNGQLQQNRQAQNNGQIPPMQLNNQNPQTANAQAFNNGQGMRRQGNGGQQSQINGQMQQFNPNSMPNIRNNQVPLQTNGQQSNMISNTNQMPGNFPANQIRANNFNPRSPFNGATGNQPVFNTNMNSIQPTSGMGPGNGLNPNNQIQNVQNGFPNQQQFPTSMFGQFSGQNQFTGGGQMVNNPFMRQMAAAGGFQGQAGFPMPNDPRLNGLQVNRQFPPFG